MSKGIQTEALTREGFAEQLGKAFTVSTDALMKKGLKLSECRYGVLDHPEPSTHHAGDSCNHSKFSRKNL